MKFVKVRYDGATPYTDRTPLKNAWEPGDVKLVSEADAPARVERSSCDCSGAAGSEGWTLASAALRNAGRGVGSKVLTGTP